jgi:hypothetical protein
MSLGMAGVRECLLKPPRLALFGTVAYRLQLESMGIKPVSRKAMWPVLGELLGLVEDDGVAGTSPRVCFSDDRSARNQECEVMKARLQA